MAQQPPPEPIPNVLIDKLIGIKNVVGREHLTLSELMTAQNIDIDDVGAAVRRRGFQAFDPRWAMSCHSLFGTQEGRYFAVRLVSNQWELQEFFPDGDIGGTGAAVGPNPVSYVQIGNTVYYSSEDASGKITLNPGEDAVYTNWGPSQDIWLSPVVNPTPTLAQIRGRLLGRPPVAAYLTWWNGRIFLGSGNTVWATELWLYDYVDKTKNFWQFEGEIGMVAAVADGIYVGTSEGVWFIGGTFTEPKRVRVMDSPVIPGSAVVAPAELANPPQVGLQPDEPVKMSVMFMTTAGFCSGQDSGECTNFTEDKVIFPDAARAAGAMFRKQDGIYQYIVVTDSEGSPEGSMRIGDYVDATIVRGGTWNGLRDGIRFTDTFVATMA